VYAYVALIPTEIVLNYRNQDIYIWEVVGGYGICTKTRHFTESINEMAYICKFKQYLFLTLCNATQNTRRVSMNNKDETKKLIFYTFNVCSNWYRLQWTIFFLIHELGVFEQIFVTRIFNLGIMFIKMFKQIKSFLTFNFLSLNLIFFKGGCAVQHQHNFKWKIKYYVLLMCSRS